MAGILGAAMLEIGDAFMRWAENVHPFPHGSTLITSTVLLAQKFPSDHGLSTGNGRFGLTVSSKIHGKLPVPKMMKLLQLSLTCLRLEFTSNVE